MQCFLCLKDTDAFCAISNIKLDSKEAILLGIPYIIEKHFWLQISNVPATRHIVCAQCWHNLYTFHKFYLEVQAVHNALEEEVDRLGENDTNKECAFTLVEQAPQTEIKQEIQRMSSPLPLPVKRTSNRLKLKSLQAAVEKVNKKHMEFVLEEINLNEIKIELPEADITMADVLEDNVDVFDPNDTAQCTSDVEVPPVAITYKKKPKRKYMKKKKIGKAIVKPAGDVGELKLQKMRQCDEAIKKCNFKLQCSICSEQFPDFTKLTAHFRQAHQKRGYAMCCNKKFFKRCTLVDHLHQHENPEYFKCNICDKVLGERRSLELHIQLHTMKKMGRNYKCEQCNKSYYNHKIFLRHQLTHVPDELRTVSCTQCNKLFVDKYAMQQHVALVHLKKYAKICDICGKAIQGKDALARHIQEHEGIERELVQCDMCGVKLTTKYGLARHKKMMHTVENRQPKQCPICLKISPSLQSYLTHVKYMHNLERKHQCPMCEKAFKRKPDLREHMTTHTGDVLYTCPHCPKTFNSNANMHSHRKKMHRKEWEENRMRRYHHPSIDKQTIKSLSEHITATKRNASLTINTDT